MGGGGGWWLRWLLSFRSQKNEIIFLVAGFPLQNLLWNFCILINMTVASSEELVLLPAPLLSVWHHHRQEVWGWSRRAPLGLQVQLQPP